MVIARGQSWFVISVLILTAAPAPARGDDWQQLAASGREAHERGDYAGAEALFQRALKELAASGKDDPGTASVLDDMASLDRKSVV